MAVHRYWRMVGFAVNGAGPLELSEVRLLAAGDELDASATLTCTSPPTTGSLADLKDGLADRVVSWPYSAHSSSGFALAWDFGSGGDVDVDEVRLGSGSGESTYPMDIALQYSDDASTWVSSGFINSLVFPGIKSLTSATKLFKRYRYFRLTITKWRFNGVDGSAANTDTRIAEWEIYSLENVKYPKVNMVGDSSPTPLVASASSYAGAFYPWNAFDGVVSDEGRWISSNNGGVQWLQIDLGAGNEIFPSYTKIAPDAAVSIGSGYFPVDFKVEASNTGLFEGEQLVWLSFTGVVSGWVNTTLRTFAPGVVTVAEVRLRRHALRPDILQGSLLASGAAYGHARPLPFFDAYHGGLGTIYGTVKEKNAPANTPLRRKVWLMDERSGLVIRETWSDAATGAYEFRGIKQGVPCTVLAYDHAHNYRAVIADNLLPEVLP